VGHHRNIVNPLLEGIKLKRKRLPRRLRTKNHSFAKIAPEDLNSWASTAGIRALFGPSPLLFMA